jgi:hypothetical protein
MPYIQTSPTTIVTRIPDGVRGAEALLIDIIDAVREPTPRIARLPWRTTASVATRNTQSGFQDV